jgi:dTMP kinase
MRRPGGLLVSLEGVSGCGKTYFAGRLRERLRVAAEFVKEVSDRSGGNVDQDILSILGRSGDRFFRGGLPRTETFLLLALKMYDYEEKIKPKLDDDMIVIEDRSIDTIAIYQAILLGEEQDRTLARAESLYQLASHWRRAPDVTFLIVDELRNSIRRAEERMGRAFRHDEVSVLERADELYSAYAPGHAGRMIPLDRRLLPEEEILAEMVRVIATRCQ